MEEKDKRSISKSKKTPTFIVELWHEDNYKDLELPRDIKKRMWCGTIFHVQGKEKKPLRFNQVSEMLKFMEDHRIE